MTGKELIAYIRAWQKILNEVAAQNGIKAFQFNTYIISVLVLFFLQVSYDLPRIARLPSALSKNFRLSSKTVVNELACDFFYFYAKYYEIGGKVISLSMGRWQDLKAPKQQKQLTPELKR